MNRPAIREATQFDASLPDLIRAVREQGPEGLVAKRLDSAYEPGLRSGAWRKMRVNRSEDFIIGGYTVGGRHFDALIFGYWEGDRLMYAAADPERFHACRARAVGDAGLPVRESAGGAGRPLGRGLERRKDKKLPVAEAGPRSAYRIRRVDLGQALKAFTVRGASVGRIFPARRAQCP